MKTQILPSEQLHARWHIWISRYAFTQLQKKKWTTKSSVQPILNKGKCTALHMIFSSATVPQCSKSCKTYSLLAKSELRVQVIKEITRTYIAGMEFLLQKKAN